MKKILLCILYFLVTVSVVANSDTGADRAVTVGELDVLEINVGEVVDVYADKKLIIKKFGKTSASVWVDHAWVMFNKGNNDSNNKYLKISHTDASIGLSTLVGLEGSPNKFMVKVYYSISWRYSGDITVNVAQSEYYFYVRVKDVKPTKISLPETLNLGVGEKETLRPAFTPSSANAQLTWNSDNESVASISSSGVVIGIGEGSTSIHVSTDNGLEASCKVKVIPSPTSISLADATIREGYGKKLVPNLYPEASTTKYTWKSSDKSIATISASGFVTAKKQGTATITCSTQNDLSATCIITVVSAESGRSATEIKSRLKRTDSLISKIKNKLIK